MTIAHLGRISAIICTAVAGCFIALSCPNPAAEHSNPGPGPLLNPSSPTTFHVDLSGNDSSGDGSAAKPWRHVAYAASRIGADGGHTIKIGTGFFDEKDQIVLETGVNLVGAGIDATVLSSSVIIASTADGKDGFLIRASSNGPQSVVSANPTAIPDGNQTIEAFTLDGNGKTFNGLWVERRNEVTIRGIRFVNCASMGARVFEQLGKDAAYLTGIEIRDCRFENCAADFNSGGSGFDSGDYSTGNLNIGGLDGASISGIDIDCEYGYGIKFTRDGYFKNCLISDCDIKVSEYDAMWGEDIAIELWNLGPGNEVRDVDCNTWISIVNHPGKFASPTGTENIELHRIIIRDEDGESEKEGIECGTPGMEIHDCVIENKGFGFAVWDQGARNITIRNNIVRNEDEHGALWNGGAGVFIANSKDWDFGPIRIYHNVFDSSNNGVYAKSESAYAISGIDIANNVFLRIPSAGSAVKLGASGDGSLDKIQNITVRNNIVDNEAPIISGKTPGAWLKSSGNILNTAPGFSPNGEDPLFDWYQILDASSAAVNAGIDLGFPYTGSAPDIGRSESDF